MVSELWASYGDALKLILTGSPTGTLSSLQRTIFTNMLAQGLRDENGAQTELRNLPTVNIIKHCTSEEKQEFETLYYIPDLFRFMTEIYGEWNIHTLPVDLKYLTSLKNDLGETLLNLDDASSQQDWLDTIEGKEYWDLLCKKIDLKNELAELDTMHHGGVPSEKAKLKQLRKETNDELVAAVKKIAIIDNKEPPFNKTYIPYLRALKHLMIRLQATPEELAAWIFLGEADGGLSAFTNSNELNDSLPFGFTELSDQNYLDQLVSCWFNKDDIYDFQPQDRFITGQALIDRWTTSLGKQVYSFIQVKINESSLLDFHPVTGVSQWTEDESYPPKETALFVLSHIEAIEKADGVLVINQTKAPEVGSPLWRSKNAKNAADAKHDKPGGSRDKQKQMREIWATGKYTSRDRCAEEECAALDISFSAARNALKNQPKPK